MNRIQFTDASQHCFTLEGLLWVQHRCGAFYILEQYRESIHKRAALPLAKRLPNPVALVVLPRRR